MRPLRAPLLIALLAVAPVQAQATVHVLLPEPMAAEAAQILQEALGQDAVVRPVAWDRLAEAGPGVLFGADEYQLWQCLQAQALSQVRDLAKDLPRGCRDLGERWVLPWTLRYELAYAVEVFGETPPRTWEDLALAHEMHDRLGLCPPRVDPTPWLAAMEESLLGGNGQKAGFALWTTLDARVPGYAGDYGELQEGLANGALVAAVMPRPIASQLRQRLASEGGRQLRGSGLGLGTPVARIGLAVQGALDPETEALLRLLAAEPLRTDLAGKMGLEVAVSGGAGVGRAELDGPAVDRWLQHFETEVEGKGRGVEAIADALDLAFTLLFFGGIFGIWLYYRRNGKDPAGAEEPSRST